MTNFSQIPGVKFICGRPFDTEFGHHDPGEIVEEAPGFNMLESIVRSGLLYPYAPEAGYDYLPPHLFSDTRTRQEVLDQIKGDSTMTVRDPFRDENGAKPEPMLQAEREADIAKATGTTLTHNMDEEKMQKAADDLNKDQEKLAKEHLDTEGKRLKDLAAGKDPLPFIVPDASAAADSAERSRKSQDNAVKAVDASSGKASTS